MRNWIEKNGFNAGFLVLVLATLLDPGGIVCDAGQWLHRGGGATAAIILIFLFSGLMLSVEALRVGARDVVAWSVSLALIFLVSPLVAAALGALPLPPGLRIGLFLVAVMPTTLSSGVVMTASAGGRMATALTTTITANVLAVLTIPVILGCLIGQTGLPVPIQLDKSAMMARIFLLVVVPFFVGLSIRRRWGDRGGFPRIDLNGMNQVLVLLFVWMALSPVRQIVLGLPGRILAASLISIGFHGVLLLFAFGFCRMLGVGPGRRESVIFMGCQKTLPLSVILQASLFSDYPESLLFCVVHHFLHLFVDGYLVTRIQK